MNNKEKKLFNNTFLFLIGNIGSKFIQFFLVPLYTYCLTVSEYGKTDLVFTLINFLIPIFSIQLSDSLLRFGLDKNVKRDDTYNSVFKILIFSTIFSIISSPLLLFFKSLSHYIIYLIIILNLRVYRDILSIILKIEDKNKYYAIDSILYTFILCISSIILLCVFKIGIIGYFLSYIIANVFSIFFIIFISNFSINIFKRKIDNNLTKKILIYSLPLVLNSIAYWITSVSDRFMINYFMGISYVGIYAIACKIPTILSTLTGVFNQAWLLSSIDEYENEKDENFYKNIFISYISVSFIISSILIIIIKPFMYIYVSNDFFVSWKFATILISSAIYSGICSFLNSILYAFKKTNIATFSTIIGAIINVILNLILIPKFGIMGASVATIISWIIITFIKIFDVKKLINFDVNLFKIILLSFINIIIAILTININYMYSLCVNIPLLFIILFICKNTFSNIVRKCIKILRKKVKK